MGEDLEPLPVFLTPGRNRELINKREGKVRKLTPSAILYCESEFGDLLRRLPFHTRGKGWRCPECGAFLRNGRVREDLYSPCEEKNASEVRDAWEEKQEPLPLADRRITERVVQMFWSKVARNGKARCWTWTGETNNGTPHLTAEQGAFTARRVSFEIHHGPLPRSVNVYPVCKNRRCVNPEHLQAGGKA